MANEPYLPGRTRMPFDIPLPPPDQRDQLAQLMGGPSAPPIPRYGAAPPRFAPGTMRPGQPGQGNLDPAAIRIIEEMIRQQQGRSGAVSIPPPVPMPQFPIPQGKWR